MRDQKVAFSRYWIIEQFAQVEDFVNLIIFYRYTNSFIDDFVQDLLMPSKTGFGLKMDLLENIIKKENILSGKDRDNFIKILRNMMETRNYFAHTVLSHKEVQDGKIKHRGVRKVIFEVDLEEMEKGFHKNFAEGFPIIATILDYTEKQNLERQKLISQEL